MLVLWGVPFFIARRKYSETFSVDTVVNGWALKYLMPSGMIPRAANDNVADAA